MPADPVTRADLLLALDGVVAGLLSLRKLIEHAEEEPEVGDPADWRGPCPDRDGLAHRAVWAPALAVAPDGMEDGVCEVCGTEFTRPAPADVVGVSGPETGSEQP